MTRFNVTEARRRPAEAGDIARVHELDDPNARRGHDPTFYSCHPGLTVVSATYQEVTVYTMITTNVRRKAHESRLIYVLTTHRYFYGVGTVLPASVDTTFSYGTRRALKGCAAASRSEAGCKMWPPGLRGPLDLSSLRVLCENRGRRRPWGTSGGYETAYQGPTRVWTGRG